MKYYVIILSALASLGIISCHNNYKNPNENPDGISEEIISEESVTLEEKNEFQDNSCYRYESSKDTVSLRLNRTDNEVSGTLSYNYLEKAKDKGSFKGRIVGDTIFADYTYDSPEKKGVREVIFIKKDSSLVEGYGETEEIKGKTKFKTDAILSFNEAISLEQVECD